MLIRESTFQISNYFETPTAAADETRFFIDYRYVKEIVCLMFHRKFPYFQKLGLWVH